MTKIELLHDHEHEGRPYPRGHVLDVDAATAAWLIKHERARAARPSPAARGTRLDPVVEPKPPKEE